MTHSETPVPTEIKLHKVSRVLEVSFADGARFELPVASLHEGDAAAAAEVGIARIAPLGNGAISLHFDDGRESGPLSWADLYRRGSALSGDST